MTARRWWLAALGLGVLACAASRGNEPPRPSPPPPPPSASAAPVDASPPAPARAPIGAGHPMLVLEASRSGDWVAFCEAREDSDRDGRIAVAVGAHGSLLGDRLIAQLALGTGRVRAIDALAGAADSGRWVVVLAAGKLVLIDAVTGAETELDADTRSDGAAHRRHRALAFTSDSRHLAYLRRTKGGTIAVVRALETGKEWKVTPAPGSVWRIETEPLGAFVVLRQVTADGRWPEAEARPLPACGGALPTFVASAPRGDPVSVALGPLAGGSAKPVDGFVVALQGGLVVREADGRLVLRQTTDLELAPASCGARVLHADPARNLLLVACTAATGRPPLELVGPAFRKPLDVDISFLGHDLPPGAGERLVPVYPGAETALVDFEARQLVKLRAGDAVVTTSGPRALLRRDNRLVVTDVDSKIDTLLPGTTTPLAVALATERMAVVAPLVADVQRGRLLGSIAEEPLAIARDGRVLVALGGRADADALAVGPLEWRTPATGTGP